MLAAPNSVLHKCPQVHIAAAVTEVLAPPTEPGQTTTLSCLYMSRMCHALYTRYLHL